jgi:hypothetical protein
MDEERMTPKAANQADGTAFGGTAPLVNLNDLALRMLQRLVQLTARDAGGELDGQVDTELQELLQRACCTARGNGLHAEQLVIILKHVWIGMPIPAARRDHRVEDAFDRLVSLCIEEFFRTE